jgi:hypothetical protein
MDFDIIEFWKTGKVSNERYQMNVFSKSTIILLVIAMFLGIGLRAYKMHCTGIVADEAWTYRDFCTDVQTAVTNYKNVNNHVLNSVLIVLTRKVLGKYEHFIRIPALLFGALFCIAVASIIHKTISSSALRIVVLLFVLMNWFIVDLTYLARGYSIALGVTFAGIAVLINLLSRTAEDVKVNWLVVILLIAMNFFAFGSMLSSLSILLSINIAYLALIILGSMKLGKKALIHAIIRVIVIVLGSAVSLWLLYHRVYLHVIAKSKSKSFKVEPFGEYLKKVLWEPLIYFDTFWMKYNKLVYNVSLVLLVVCAVICLFAFCFRWKARKGRSLSLISPAIVILLLSGGVLFFMFIQTVVFGMSLGMPRNGVFLLPLVLIGSGIFMDRAANALLQIKILPFLLRSACIVVLAILCFLNLPSLRAVNVRPYDWGKQSSVGPLIRMLRQIDPDKAWKIKLTSPYLAALEKPLKYYAKFGHKVERVTKEYDVVMYPEHPPDGRLVYFENEFFEDHHCRIVVNTSSFRDKRVFYQMHY